LGFDKVRLKNQFKIVENPELVFSIVTSEHATFTRKDIAKVLHRYMDDAGQFQTLMDRLMTSQELVTLELSEVHKDTNEPVYTTKEMLRIEMNLVKTAEDLAAQKTHDVNSKVIEKAIANQNEKLANCGGLSADQETAIRHMLSSDQISCVVGFVGAGKTICLEAAKEAWKESGYKIIGLAPTVKAVHHIEDCGIQSMTIHQFLKAQGQDREQITDQSIVVLDDAGMIDHRQCSELLSIIGKTGAKIVPMGNGHPAQSIEASHAFRLLTGMVKPAVLETIVYQQEFQQGKGFWNAIKVTVLDIFLKALDRSQESNGPKEAFQDFKKDSETMRSQDFFEHEASQKSQETADNIEKQEKARLLKQQSIDVKRQEFEKEQLPFNQEWCTKLGFFFQHKRYPEDATEINTAYWQAERLTAIEGRIYKGALEKGQRKVDDEKIILKARDELKKNQAVPDFILTFGKASDLTDQQLKKFEQHVLVHQDKTNRVPEPAELVDPEEYD